MTIDRQIFRQADFIEVAVDNVVTRAARRRPAGHRHRAALPRQPARGRDHADGDAAVAGGGRARRCARSAPRINTMTLGGMAIAIGALVDDAIIDVENVVRRLRENSAQARGERRPAADVVRDATLEIRTSIVFATVIIVLVFLPIFGLAGVEGRLLTPLAFAYIVALLASLAVAIVVTPALCYAFLPQARDRFERGHDGWLARTLKARFARDPAARARPSARGRGGCRCAAARRGARGAHADGHGVPAGVPRRQPDRAGEHAARHVAGEVRRDRPARRADPARRSPRSSRRRGGPAAPSYDEHVQGVEAAEIDVGLRETGRPRDELLAELRRGFSTLPGTNVTIGQPISHRIDHMLSGTRANIAVKVFGDDLRDAAAAGRARARRDAAGSRASWTSRSSSRWTSRSCASC